MLSSEHWSFCVPTIVPMMTQVMSMRFLNIQLCLDTVEVSYVVHSISAC